MAAQKRRKPTGVTSFVGDVLAEQRKARERDARLQVQAAEAWAKQDAKDAARGAREQARQDRQAEREQEIAAGHAEADGSMLSLTGWQTTWLRAHAEHEQAIARERERIQSG